MDWKDALSAARNNFEPANDENIIQNDSEPIEKSPAQKGPVTVVTDKKGRNGKTATIIEGLTIPQNEVEDLARKLKQKLGVGGSVREGEILVQGDHKESVKKFLTVLNFKVK